jgi:uncharacterized membrane protein YeiB
MDLVQIGDVDILNSYASLLDTVVVTVIIEPKKTVMILMMVMVVVVVVVVVTDVILVAEHPIDNTKETDRFQ